MEPNRPRVDVVVPFVGSDEELLALRSDLRARLALGADDTLTIVDNRLSPQGTAPADVVRASDRASSYYARNAGAAVGDAPWIVFLDSDVTVGPDLLDAYFAADPPERVGQLIGRIDPVAESPGPVARYGVSEGHLSQDNVSYGLTANVAVRRAAFEAIGGFDDVARSGGDADFTFRLRDAGWDAEPRRQAGVSHPTRDNAREMLRVFARYGSGAQWLRRRYPDFAPPVPVRLMALWTASAGVRIPLALVRRRREEAVTRALDLGVLWASELGRLLPNLRSPTRAQRRRHLGFALRDRTRRRRD